MANRQFLINYHTSGAENMPLSGDVKLGEIIVRHNDQKPELLLLKDNGSFAKFIDSVAINTLIDSAKTNLEGQIDAVVSNLEQNYATSANTVAAIESVDAKFANYATSADTAAAIKVVQDGVDSVAQDLETAVSSLTETINNKVSAAFIYKGTKNNFSELPLTGNVKGDVWNVVNANGNIPAGTNYAWDGSAWDALAGTVDLTIFATSAATVAAIKVVQDGVDAVDKKLVEGYATSADTASAIKAVDNKFANYATSADTAAAIKSVDNKFANYATSADTAAAIKVVQDGVDAIDLRVDKLEALSATTSSAVQSIEISGITGVSATKVGTKYTIDFTNMVIDGGSF